MEEGLIGQTYFQLISFFGPKILIAILCGGIIGFERELKHKAAGIKTNMLICAGAALYTAMSVHLSQAFAAQGHLGDPGRLAAQIVSGIGFLGGGAIIQARGTVVGLTTAATIWIVAAIGICVGLGYYSTGLSSTILVVLVLIAVSWFETRVIGRRHLYALEIVLDDPNGERRKRINHHLEQSEVTLEDFRIERTHENFEIIKIKYRCNQRQQRTFLGAIWSADGVKEVRQV